MCVGGGGGPAGGTQAARRVHDATLSGASGLTAEQRALQLPPLALQVIRQGFGLAGGMVGCPGDSRVVGACGGRSSGRCTCGGLGLASRGQGWMSLRLMRMCRGRRRRCRSCTSTPRPPPQALMPSPSRAWRRRRRGSGCCARCTTCSGCWTVRGLRARASMPTPKHRDGLGAAASKPTREFERHGWLCPLVHRWRAGHAPIQALQALGGAADGAARGVGAPRRQCPPAR